MTILRQRMIEDMQVRNLSSSTQHTYLLHVSLFARHLHKSPAVLGPEELRSYQVYLTNEKKLAPAEKRSLPIAVDFSPCCSPSRRPAKPPPTIAFGMKKSPALR